MPYGIIYCATNTVNGKYYIGQTTQALKQRAVRHKRRQMNPHFGSAIKKYGFNAFEWNVLAEANSAEQLNQLETLWILSTRSYDRKVGYNLSFGGEGGGRRTDDVKAKLRAVIASKPRSEKQQAHAARLSMLGGSKTYTEDTSIKMSAALSRRWVELSPEEKELRKKKIAESVRMSWESLTEEQRALRTAQISKGKKGIPISAKAKASRATPEHKQIRSAASKAAWEKKRLETAALAA